MLFFLGDFNLTEFIAFIIVAVMAFAYHEFAHALAADRLGDSTPRSMGRMTLNPLPHLSLFGMAMLILIGFGWATTPINPRNFRRPRTDHALVAIAGPAANLLMAILFAIPLRLLLADNYAFTRQLVDMGLSLTTLDVLITFFQIGVRLNLFLIAFNLLPIPPLDGFWVLRGILPIEMAYRLDPLLQYGTLIFLAVIFVLPRMGLSVFSLINDFTSTMFGLLVGV